MFAKETYPFPYLALDDFRVNQSIVILTNESPNLTNIRKNFLSEIQLSLFLFTCMCIIITLAPQKPRKHICPTISFTKSI